MDEVNDGKQAEKLSILLKHNVNAFTDVGRGTTLLRSRLRLREKWLHFELIQVILLGAKADRSESESTRTASSSIWHNFDASLILLTQSWQFSQLHLRLCVFLTDTGGASFSSFSLAILDTLFMARRLLRDHLLLYSPVKTDSDPARIDLVRPRMLISCLLPEAYH